MKRKIGYAVFLILFFAASKAQSQYVGGGCKITLSMVDQTAATLHLTGAESFWATGVSYFDDVVNCNDALNVTGALTGTTGTFSSALHSSGNTYSSGTIYSEVAAGYAGMFYTSSARALYASGGAYLAGANYVQGNLYINTPAGSANAFEIVTAANADALVVSSDGTGDAIDARATGGGKGVYTTSVDDIGVYASGTPGIQINTASTTGNILEMLSGGAMEAWVSATGTLKTLGDVYASSSIFASQGVTIGSMQPVMAWITPGESTVASMNGIQTASATLAIGVDTLAITFSPAFENTVYAVVCSCVVPAGAAPIACSPDTVTTAGFTANIPTGHTTACAMNAIAYGR